MAVISAIYMSILRLECWELSSQYEKPFITPKKASKLTDFQAVLNALEIKINKLSDTHWLAGECCLRAVRLTLPALVSTLKKFMRAVILRHMAKLIVHIQSYCLFTPVLAPDITFVLNSSKLATSIPLSLKKLKTV